MIYKLIVIEKSHIALIYHGDDLVRLVTEHSIYRVNDIYLGKVSSVLTGIGAAFVSLDPSAKNGFIHYENLKKGKKKERKFLSAETVLQVNDDLLVQITREPVGTKGPSVTSDISLIGKYVGLFPMSEGTHITKELQNDLKKPYLRAMSCLLGDKSMGILVTAETLSANVDFLLKEVQILKFRWVRISKKSKLVTSPSLVSKRKMFLHKIFEGTNNIIFDFIAIDSYEGALKIGTILSRLYHFKFKQSLWIEFHRNSLSIIKHYVVDIILSEIIKPRVNLHTGGYIVIEKTEALTTIDVNSGSFTNLSSSRDTSLWINYYAVHEIMRQIQLRNIGGIVVIDFIDSDNQNDQMKILRYMSKLMRKDKVKCNLVQMSELGLVEITRARHGQSIYDAFTRRCNLCNGLGYLTLDAITEYNTSYELLLELANNTYERNCDNMRTLYLE